MSAWAFDVLVKATLLLLAVGTSAHVARRGSAATRHFVWACGLTGLLLLPVAAMTVPGWSPGWVNDWANELLVARDVSLDAMADLRWLAATDWRRLPGSGVAGAAVTGRGATGDGPGASPSTAMDTPTTDATPTPAGLLAVALLATWLAGVFLMTTRLAVGLARRRRLTRGATGPVAASLIEASDQVTLALGLRRRIRLIVGDGNIVPMTWGIAHPVVYLPAAAVRWRPQRLRAVLVHEIAHVKRKDSLSQLVARLACGIFWFHPLAWAAARRMLREQERACDDVVIESGAEPHAYAQTLVEIAREFRAPRPGLVGALAFSRGSDLEQRLLSILDPRARRKKMSTTRKAILAALFAATVLPLAALRPATATVREATGQQRLSITYDRADGQVRLEVLGAQRVPTRVDDIDLEAGGRMTLTEGDRRLEVRRPDESALTFSYSVGGVEQPFDEPARQWADDALGQMGGLVDLEASLQRLDLTLEQLDLSLPALRNLELPPLDLRLPVMELHLPPINLDLQPIPLNLPPMAPDLPPLDLEIPPLDLEIPPLDLEMPLASLEQLERSRASLRNLELSMPNLKLLQLPAIRAYEFDAIRSWTENGSRVVVMRRGELEIGATVDDIAVSEDGDLVIDERTAAAHHRLHVYAGTDGEPVFEYRLDGEAAPFDETARAWLRPIIERLR